MTTNRARANPLDAAGPLFADFHLQTGATPIGTVGGGEPSSEDWLLGRRGPSSTPEGVPRGRGDGSGKTRGETATGKAANPTEEKRSPIRRSGRSEDGRRWRLRSGAASTAAQKQDVGYGMQGVVAAMSKGAPE